MGIAVQADYTHNNAQRKWAKNESPEERVLRDCLLTTPATMHHDL
jgi:hypothetical protein